MLKYTAAMFAAIALSACGGGGGSQAPAEPVQVFIFAGQSNMLGSDAIITSNGTTDLAEAKEQVDADRASLFSFKSRTLSYPWGDLRGHDGYYMGEPLIYGKPAKVHGPEVGFNRRLGGNIVIIKYADNYNALENGRSAWVKPGTRWTAWQEYVDQQLATINGPYVVAGIIWDQGIDDGLLIRDGASYKADLQQIIRDVRAKFGANKPFILARSVNSVIAGSVAMAPIRAAQVEVGSEPGNRWTDEDDLGPYVASHHLSEAAQLVSGKRFAEQYLDARRGAQ